MAPLFRKPEPASVPASDSENAQAYCDRLIRRFADKAHHNKRESLLSFYGILAGTLSAPLFLGFGGLLPGNEAIWTRLIPATLSVFAAAVTAWLQLRKPQQLWALYRDAQRQLEDIRHRHQYKIGDFSEHARDQLLAEKAADIAMAVHRRWMPMIPSPEHLAGLGAGQPAIASTGDGQ